ncbi:MAG: manganese catalase family protein [Bacilli bacterium]
MFKYEKMLAYPINIRSKDLKMAKLLITQLGGSDGELGASIRYLCQRFTMPDDRGKALLTDIGCEELGHCEMISTMVNSLLENATIDEIKKEGLSSWYTSHKRGIYPFNQDGIPFNANAIACTGDALTDLQEDMAAEAKAKSTYENLMTLTNEKDILGPLNFLRQREVVHFNRFQELYNYYKNKS